MRASLPTALTLIRRHEGGYVNHPRDPGGCTNLGITLHTFRLHLKANGTCADLRRLGWSDAAGLYTRLYWAAVRGDALPAGLDISVMDMGVNAGPRNAIRLLQRLLRLPADGRLGPLTLAAALACDRPRAVDAYAAIRLEYYRQRKTWRTFGAGWSARVESVRLAARREESV